MSGTIKSLTAFKNQTRYLLKQIFNLSYANQIEALNFVLLSLSRLNLSINNVNCANSSKRKRRRPLRFTTSNLKAIARNNKNIHESLLKKRKNYSQPSKSSNESLTNNETVHLNEKSIAESSEGDNQIYEFPSDYQEKQIYETNSSDKEKLNSSEEVTLSTELTSAKNTKKKSLKKFTCYICDLLFDSYNVLLEHLFHHDVAPRSCYKCKNTFPNAIPFQVHLTRDCSQYASTDTSVLEFFLKVANSFENKSKDILFCPYCGLRFSKLFNVKRHLINTCGKLIHKSSKSQFECQECQMTFTSTENLETHQKIHEKYFHQCLKCNSSFPTRNLLRAHTVVHQQKKETKHQCHQCNLTFHNRLSLRMHIRKYKNDEMHSQGVNSTQIWCKICRKSFYDQYTYNRHCKRKSHLETHNPGINIEENKQIVCDKCGVTFLTQSSLSTHKSKIHSNKEPLKCDKCEFTSYSKTNLQRHISAIHEIAYKRFACDKCPAMFSAASAVKEHINSLHSDLRLFGCNTCLKTFKLKSQLTRHKAVHTSLLSFCCMHCPMGFKRRCHLTRHMKSKHKEHIPTEHVMNLDTNSLVQEMEKVTELAMVQSMGPQGASGMEEDRVFSLIDAQSGELVTLSATELSKNAVINMADGGLLSEVHLPELWNHSTTTIYSLDTLQGAVMPQAEYNIITHNPPDMECVLQKTLEDQMPKDPMHYCITQSTHSAMEHLTVGAQSMDPKAEIPQGQFWSAPQLIISP